MATTDCVAVYGGSLYLAGIATTLAAHSALEVVCVQPQAPDATRHLAALAPAAIVFDLGEALPGCALTWLKECPGTYLVGVDPASDRMVIVSGHMRRMRTMSDLVRTIVEVTRGS